MMKRRCLSCPNRFVIRKIILVSGSERGVVVGEVVESLLMENKRVANFTYAKASR